MFSPPRRKSYSDTAFTVLMTAAFCGALWLLIFSICQWVKLS